MESAHYKTPKTSILIADDHAIFSEALHLLFESKYSGRARTRARGACSIIRRGTACDRYRLHPQHQ